MPFTFCHPAIILPLSKSQKLSTSALIFGSTAPDFEYFLRMDMIRTHSHDFWAMFYFNLPLTLGLFFIFQSIVKVPLINNLPHFLFSRFSRFIITKPNYTTVTSIFWICLSAIIGIFSHLLWDSFTHKEGFFEGYFSFLLQEFYFMGKSRIVFQFLQMISSILGGGYMIYFVFKIPKQYTPKKKQYINIGFSLSYFLFL